MTFRRYFLRADTIRLVLFGLAAALSAVGQTNPVPQVLPFNLSAQTGSALPGGVALHRFGTTAGAIPLTRVTTDGNADLPYNSTSNSGGWRDEGSNGIGILASGSNAAGALVVAIDTTGKTAIQVSWICHTILQQSSRDNSVALQYRVGTSGNFIDVGTASTYTSNGKTPIDTSPTYLETLPIQAENQPVVQVRWIYWESTSISGSRDRIAIDDISITGSASGPTNPTASASSTNEAVPPGQSTLLTVTVVPGANPASTGITVTGDLTAIGGSASQAFTPGPGNTFTYLAAIPANLAFGAKLLSFTVTDAQARTATTSLTLQVRGNVTIFHTNDMHARVTPHKWIVPEHTIETTPEFEEVGGVAFVGAKVLSLATATPDSLVLDGGDISEGNPIGDWNGPPSPVGVFGNGTIVNYYKLLDAKLKLISARGGRGLDAMVVGNHDIREISYMNNLKDPSVVFPVLSINLCNKGTHTPYFSPYTIINLNGNKIGIIGYTTESADSLDPNVNAAIDVVKCDWSSADSTKIHFSDYVNQLRNVEGCNLVFLLTHMGHSGLCVITGANPTPILVDNTVAKVPEVVISGHWHTYAETVWQPTSLNYKTIFTEAGSFTHYVSELRVNGAGKYVSNANYPLRTAAITPDPDIAALVQSRKDAYAATNPTYGVDQVIGYTADNLLLDNYMKWWTSDEYPWSGDNTAGGWICDAIKWKTAQLFGNCDLAIESGGGVRSDIAAGPVTYSAIYETFPWADDYIYRVKMTGQEIWNYIKGHGCDVGVSREWFITAHDGVPTSITYNGLPLNLSQQYTVGINNYMYTHDSVPFTDTNPDISTFLARTALIEHMALYPQNAPYVAGPSRYSMDTEFSGGYRAVVTMISDNNSRPTFDCAFIRILEANAETLGHRGTRQVPVSLINADGSAVPTNRLVENQLYRSYLGFRSGVLKPGDIIETWGKGAFFEGNPEFVDQEGIQSDGVEFKIVGSNPGLAKPVSVPDLTTALDDEHKNHYVKLLLKKTGTNTAADANGNVATIWDVAAFQKKTLPGNINDLIVVTGVPTSESFSMRFRCDSAVLASTLGITSFPAPATVTSQVDAIAPGTTVPSIQLSATAGATQGITYELQPVADAHVSSANPTLNYGTSTTMYLQSSSGGFGNERAWFRFDLNQIPAGLTVTDSKLLFYCWGAATTSMPVSVSGSSNDAWTETGLTWNNQPAFGATADTQTLAANSTNLYYSWDVSSFTQGEYSGDKTASFVAKAVSEGANPEVSYRFDSKEFGSNAPILRVTTQASGPTPVVAKVAFYYRFSSDNGVTPWGAWTPISEDTSAPFTATFGFPNGFGHYEFYSIATDTNNHVEPTPNFAQTATHYAALPSYTRDVIITLGNLTQVYNTAQHPITATTIPSGVPVVVTYGGSTTPPTQAGTYAINASVNAPGYTGSVAGSLAVAKASQSINFDPLDPVTAGSAPFSLSGTATSGLVVVYGSSNPAVATVSGHTVTVIGPGQTTITAYQMGDSNYLPAPQVQRSLDVNSASGGSGVAVPIPEWALVMATVLLAFVAVVHFRRKSNV